MGRFPRGFLFLLILGVLLLSGGIGMRVYAMFVQRQIEQRLLAARPASPDVIVSPNMPEYFPPATGNPTKVRLPAYDLWNTLEPVKQKISWQNGTISAEWEVSDAGWHSPSGLPGQRGNVVLAGHSPASDPAIWSRSVFRQLAYLPEGERVELFAGNRVYIYRIKYVFIISEAEAQTSVAGAWIERGDDEWLTLVTCWPPHTAAYRVLVLAEPVESKELVDQ